MNPTTYDTIQAHLTDLRRDAARQRHPAPARPVATPSRPILTFTHTVEIDRPVPEVFAFLEDFTHIPLWNYWILDVRTLTDGPIGVGTLFHQVRRDDRQTYRLEVHQPHRRLRVATVDSDGPTFTRTFELEPTGNGTRLTDGWSLDTGHPPALQRLAGRRIRDGVMTNLTKLTELLEAGSTVLPDGRAVRVDRD